MPYKKDCFAAVNNGCIALKKVICDKRKCPFYKTAAKLREEREKAAERNRALGIENESTCSVHSVYDAKNTKKGKC